MCQSRAAEGITGKEEAVEVQGMCYIRQERLCLHSFPSNPCTSFKYTRFVQ